MSDTSGQDAPQEVTPEAPTVTETPAAENVTVEAPAAEQPVEDAPDATQAAEPVAEEPDPTPAVDPSEPQPDQENVSADNPAEDGFTGD